jgi:carbonic anhydrase
MRTDATLAGLLSEAPDIEDLLAHAERHAREFEANGAGPVPVRGVAIVTCMDCRINPYALLGLSPGDAHVIRNAGGIVTDDVLRSLALSQALLETRQILVIQHTGCGLEGDEADLRRQVAEAAGAEPPWPLGAFDDVEASVRRQVALLRGSPWLLGGESARGFVYDVETGRLREVASDETGGPGSS